MLRKTKNVHLVVYQYQYNYQYYNKKTYNYYYFQALAEWPTPETFGKSAEVPREQMVRWVGGETRALQHLVDRLKVEEAAFHQGIYLPNNSRPDLLAPPTSQSPALRFGCLSVRR